MKISHVSVYGFRSLELVERVAIASPTILAGHNDAGKTAILDALSFLLGQYQPVEEDLTYLEEERGVRHQILTVEAALTAGPDREHRIRRLFEGGKSRYEVLRDVPQHEDLRGLGTLLLPDLRSRVSKYGLNPTSTRKADLLAALTEYAQTVPQERIWAEAEPSDLVALPTLLRFDPVSDTDPEAAAKAVLQAAYRTHIAEPEIAETIHSVETELNELITKDAAGIIANIGRRLPDLGEVTFAPEVSFSGALRNTRIVVDAIPGQPVGLQQSGTGRSRRIALAIWEHTTDLLADNDHRDIVVVYDEPDAHLDYRHQRTLMALLRDQCSLPNVQMVLATHSMNLIDGIDLADVVHVRQDEGRTRIEVLGADGDAGAHIGTIARSLGLRNTVLLNERLFLGVEGITEMAAFPVLFKHVIGHALESAGIALWECGNNEGAMLFASYLTSKDRDVVFVVDADSKSRKNIFSEDGLRQRGINPATQAFYIGDPNEFEELFDDELWAATANRYWPKQIPGVWRAAEIEAIRADSKFSTDLVETLRRGSPQGPHGKEEVGLRVSMMACETGRIPPEISKLFGELATRASSSL